MHVKHTNILNLLTRTGVGMILLSQLTACSGLQSPSEWWKQSNDPRAPQAINGPRRVPMLNKVPAPAVVAQPEYGAYQPTSSVEQAAPAANSQPQAVTVMRQGDSDDTVDVQQTEPSPYDKQPASQPSVVDRISGWFSSMAEPVSQSEPTKAADIKLADGSTVSMKTAASVETRAVQSVVSNNPASTNDTQSYLAVRKPISGNPQHIYATTETKFESSIKPPMVLEFEDEKPKKNPAVVADSAPVAIKPEQQSDFRTSQLLSQITTQSQTPSSPFPENTPSYSALVPAAGGRKEDVQPMPWAENNEPTQDSQQMMAQSTSPSNGELYPPLESVPPTPRRLQAVGKQHDMLKSRLEAERELSDVMKNEVDAQKIEETPGSLLNAPKDSMATETPVSPESRMVQPAETMAGLEPAAGQTKEQILGHVSDGTAEIGTLKGDERAAAMSVLDESFESTKVPEKTPVEKKSPLAAVTSEEVRKKERIEKRAVVLKSKTKPERPPIDQSLVKNLELPKAYTADVPASISAAAMDENRAESHSPSIEMTMTVEEALAQLKVQPAAIAAVDEVNRSKDMPLAHESPMYEAPKIVQTPIVLPPAQFDDNSPYNRPQASLPLPPTPIAPVAANQFLVSQFARKIVGVFSFVPDYVYLPVLNEARQVHYLPDSRYVR